MQHVVSNLEDERRTGPHSSLSVSFLQASQASSVSPQTSSH